jgi:hypothetical protein
MLELRHDELHMDERPQQALPSGRPFAAPEAPAPVASGPVPTFSLIVAAYGVAHLIPTALDAVLAQTLPPHEIIVCDDGSTDDLEAALRPYLERITVLRQENGGFASACNALVRAATGDFVVITDPDDVFAPERLEALAELAVARPDLDILTTDAEFDVDGHRFGRFYDGGTDFDVDDQRRAILSANFVFGLAALRRERVLAVGGFDESIVLTSNWELFIRMILDGALAGLVAEQLATYRLREGSLTSKRARMLRGRLATLSRTLVHPGLSEEEHTIVARSIAEQRRELALEEARSALVERRSDARRRALGVALGRSYPLRTRAKAALSFALPVRAGRQLEQGYAAAQGDPLSPKTARE